MWLPAPKVKDSTEEPQVLLGSEPGQVPWDRNYSRKEQMRIVLLTCRSIWAASKVVAKPRMDQDLGLRVNLNCSQLESDRILRKLQRIDGNLARFPPTPRSGCIPMTKTNYTKWDSAERNSPATAVTAELSALLIEVGGL